MITVRHIEKLWDARKYAQLLAELIDIRLEAMAAETLSQSATAPAAALALIRLDELHQAHTPVCAKLIRCLLALQQADGGWGDVATTALCLRALSLQGGHGPAVDAGIAYLAALQLPGGLWPKIPLRRMPEDPLVSAFALLQLADNDQFRAAVRVDYALAWFESHRRVESSAQALWTHARLRVPAPPTASRELCLNWS